MNHSLLVKFKFIGRALEDRRLSRTDILVLQRIVDRIGSTSEAWPSAQRIAADSTLEKPEVWRAVRRLMAAGWLLKVRQGGQARRDTNSYAVDWDFTPPNAAPGQSNGNEPRRRRQGARSGEVATTPSQPVTGPVTDAWGGDPATSGMADTPPQGWRSCHHQEMANSPPKTETLKHSIKHTSNPLACAGEDAVDPATPLPGRREAEAELGMQEGEAGGHPGHLRPLQTASPAPPPRKPINVMGHAKDSMPRPDFLAWLIALQNGETWAQSREQELVAELVARALP